MPCIKVISKRINYHPLIGVPHSDFLFGFLLKDPYRVLGHSTNWGPKDASFVLNEY